MCSYCCGNFHRFAYSSPDERETARERRFERLRMLIDGDPARLNPRPGCSLDRRRWVTLSLRRAMIVKRWEMLRRWRTLHGATGTAPEVIKVARTRQIVSNDTAGIVRLCSLRGAETRLRLSHEAGRRRSGEAVSPPCLNGLAFSLPAR
jgi:hypothetical protein